MHLIIDFTINFRISAAIRIKCVQSWAKLSGSSINFKCSLRNMFIDFKNMYFIDKITKIMFLKIYVNLFIRVTFELWTKF